MTSRERDVRAAASAAFRDTGQAPSADALAVTLGLHRSDLAESPRALAAEHALVLQSDDELEPDGAAVVRFLVPAACRPSRCSRHEVRPEMTCAIRPAAAADTDLLVDFTVREARDAEGVSLDPVRVRRGVIRALEDPRLARYWVAESPEGRIVGSISALTEWSNFHGGDYWWVQSLFVSDEARGHGVASALLDHVARLADEAGALDLRLYAHQGNARARRLYERCGLTVAPYVLMRRRL